MCVRSADVGGGAVVCTDAARNRLAFLVNDARRGAVLGAIDSPTHRGRVRQVYLLDAVRRIGGSLPVSGHVPPTNVGCKFDDYKVECAVRGTPPPPFSISIKRRCRTPGSLKRAACRCRAGCACCLGWTFRPLGTKQA